MSTTGAPGLALARARRGAYAVWRTFGPVAGASLPGLMRHPVWQVAAEGEGTGVVVVPGFGGVDASMAVLRRWLTRRGYVAAGARLGMNLGCTAVLAERLECGVAAHAAATGGPVVLLGHSRGGQLCRLVAARRPDLVRGLVMLGSPVLEPLDISGLAAAVCRVLPRIAALGVRGLLDADCVSGECAVTTSAGLSAQLAVPALAIYSRSDGVVGWRSCRDPHAEWVEVHSSHTGLGVDPQLYAHLAPRLAGWAT